MPVAWLLVTIMRNASKQHHISTCNPTFYCRHQRVWESLHSEQVFFFFFFNTYMHLHNIVWEILHCKCQLLCKAWFGFGLLVQWSRPGESQDWEQKVKVSAEGRWKKCGWELNHSQKAEGRWSCTTRCVMVVWILKQLGLSQQKALRAHTLGGL